MKNLRNYFLGKANYEKTAIIGFVTNSVLLVPIVWAFLTLEIIKDSSHTGAYFFSKEVDDTIITLVTILYLIISLVTVLANTVALNRAFTKGYSRLLKLLLTMIFITEALVFGFPLVIIFLKGVAVF